MTTNLSEHIQKSAQGTNLPNNQTEHKQNSAQHSNVTKNPAKHIQNSAEHIHKSVQGTSVPNNQTEYIQNSAKKVTQPEIVQNTFQTVRKALEYQTIIHKTFKRCGKH